MYEYIYGHVKRQDPETSVLTVITSGGLGLGVYFPSKAEFVGKDTALWLWPHFSGDNGYTFYGFTDLQLRKLAEFIWKKADGAGPKISTNVCHAVGSLQNLLKHDAKSLSAAVKGVGPKTASAILLAVGLLEAIERPSNLREALTALGLPIDTTRLAAAEEAGRTTAEKIQAYLALR